MKHGHRHRHGFRCIKCGYVGGDRDFCPNCGYRASEHDKPCRSLTQYATMLKEVATRTKCWCGRKDIHLLPLHMDNHPDGYSVEGHFHLQWLWVMCPECKYEWALWKLGVVHPLNDK
jgi:hypothetical protein